MQVPEIRRRSDYVEADSGFWLALARAVVIVAAFVAFCWALRRMRQESAEQLGQLAASQRQARADIQALSEKMTALATLIAAIPTRVEQRPAAPPPPPAPRREPAPVRSYETAHRLARSGASVEEIMATCGVANSEARLLRRLHGGAAGRENAA
jgi:hypothetical protein